MNYNLTNYTNVSNLLDMAVEANTLTGGKFGPVVLLLTYAVAFVSLKNYSSVDAFLASSFITAVLAGFLWVVGLVSEIVLLMVFTLFLVSLLVHFINGK